MKKVLLDSSKNFYKACLHCHSNKSDGALSVEKMKELYMEKGYSIVAFTEHEYLLDNSYLNDDNFLTITSCELGINEEYLPFQKRDMKVCHLNLFAKDPKNIDTPCFSSKYLFITPESVKDKILHTCGEYKRVYSANGISEMIRIANEKGFLVSYNHPRWSLENATDYLGYKGIWAVEVFNTDCNYAGLYEYDINSYDDFLRDGQRIACVMGDDSHNVGTIGGGWIMINAEELEYSKIIKELENHNFYASNGPVIKELYIEDGTATLTFSKGAFAVMSTKGRRVEKKYATNPNEENIVSFNFLQDDGYIRFDVVDEYGKRANTNAYFIDEIITKNYN